LAAQCRRAAAAGNWAHRQGVTSGLNFTQNHRFEFAAAVAAGAVD
jgi:hypothetical protein